jgi:hypothetical protein
LPRQLLVLRLAARGISVTDVAVERIGIARPLGGGEFYADVARRAEAAAVRLTPCIASLPTPQIPIEKPHRSLLARRSGADRTGCSITTTCYETGRYVKQRQGMLVPGLLPNRATPEKSLR